MAKVNVTARVEQEVKASIMANARDLGISVSEYVGTLISGEDLPAASYEYPDFDEMAEALASRLNGAGGDEVFTSDMVVDQRLVEVQALYDEQAAQRGVTVSFSEILLAALVVAIKRHKHSFFRGKDFISHYYPVPCLCEIKGRELDKGFEQIIQNLKK